MKLSVFCVFLFCLLFAQGVIAQEIPPKTNSIDTNASFDKKKERPDRNHYMTIIKNDTKGILYGNKCFEDFTRSIGFVYSVQIKGNVGGLSGAGRFFHNTGVKTALFFTAWPWWKLRVNKKKKDCRKLSGDFVG